MNTSNENHKVPVLITCDVDPRPEATVKDKKRALGLVRTMFRRFGIKATMFFVADLAETYKDHIPGLLADGHEIGCHGLTHGLDEEYNRLSEPIQRMFLVRATRLLERITGNNVFSFRGPRVKTSAVTQGILEELGYGADSSVCSQRLDFVSSNLINLGWIFAPRLPYHPRTDNPFKRGNRSVTVVPVSAVGLPFVSGVLYVLGREFMIRFFDLLYRESRRTGKPIVYLFHPAEFVRAEKHVDVPFSWSRIRIDGFGFRKRLKQWRSEEQRLHDTETLFEYIRRHRDVEFLTMRDYVQTRFGVRRQNA